MAGKWVRTLRINVVGMSLLRKSAPWCQKSSWLDNYFIHKVTIFISEGEDQESQVPGSLFRGSLIPGVLRCNMKACDFLLYYKITGLKELFFKEPSASEPPARSFPMQIPRPQLRLVESEVLGGWPVSLWAFYKLFRRLLKTPVT